MRKQYVFTLFLAQLFHNDDVPWVLLGGNALLIRTGSGRFTQDIDLAREAEWVMPDEALLELNELLAAGRGDSPFLFALKSIHSHSEPDGEGYGAATAKVHAEALLGSVVFEHFQIDLTTRRHADAPVDQVPLARVIDHESLNNLPSVPTVPVENHLADKICAIYERHGRSGTTPSTRYRDLADVVRIIMGTTFSAERLGVVLKRESDRRKMSLPDRFVSPDDSWAASFPIAARGFAEYPDRFFSLEASLSFAGGCLDNVLAGTRVSGNWDPEQQTWTATAT